MPHRAGRGLGGRAAAGGDLDAGAPRPGAVRQGVRGRGQPGGRLSGGEVLNAQPPGIRDLLLRTSVLDSFDAGIASELSDGHAGNDVSDLVRANAFVLPAGAGWYRYHALFADVLRLKLRHESPDLVPELHRRAAGWYQRNGLLTQAVRHAAAAGDWQLAARVVVGELAVGRLTQAGGDHSLADEFTR